jgi:hypothetical protein
MVATITFVEGVSLNWVERDRYEAVKQVSLERASRDRHPGWHRIRMAGRAVFAGAPAHRMLSEELSRRDWVASRPFPETARAVVPGTKTLL